MSDGSESLDGFGVDQHRHGWTEDDITVVQVSGLKRTISGTAIGNMMEWYDFGVYGFIATTLGQVFFPGSSHAAQLISTFATFAAAFLVRPLGGLFFGPLGDRIGRQKVLAITMILMALGSFAIGLLPSYATLGIWAPILLLVARLVQGFSTGGEYGGAMTFLSEHSPDRRRGFLGSWLEFGTLTGYVLGASIVTGLTASLSDSALLTWGWRIPFLVAGPLGIIGLYVRLRLEETPAYEKQAETNRTEASVTLAEQFRHTVIEQWRPLLICVGLVLVWNVTNYMLTAYMPTYLSSETGIPATPALVIIVVVMVILMAAITFVGRISDRAGRKPVLAAGCGLLILLSVPAFLLIGQGGYAMVFIGTMLIGLMLVCFSSTEPSTLPALFPTNVRYGALSVGFNISVSLFGGTTPLVTESLVAATGNKLMPAFYLIAAGIFGAIAVLFTRESARKPLPGSSPSVASQAEARKVATDSKRK